MNKKEKWEKFKKTGKLEDYIDYKKDDLTITKKE